MALNPKVLKVNILGQDYVIRSSAGQKYLNEVAAYVNEKMEEVKASGIDDSQQLRIAVLASTLSTKFCFSFLYENNSSVMFMAAKTAIRSC